MPKITMIGAGSTVFAVNLLGDILSFPELSDATIVLHDIDAGRLQETATIAHLIAAVLGASPTLVSTTDRRAALEGADYALNMIQVGGYRPATVIDFEIPRRYGLRQTIGDTLGIGGIMRALRTVPVLLDICRDMEELCPGVLHLNYVNPMAMNCWALDRLAAIRTVGLCHSVQGTIHELAADLDLPAGEIDYVCAGINHLAFYLKLEHQGQNLYPALHRVMEEGRAPDWNRTRYELLARMGYFATESSEHLAEYVPWFIKRDRPDLIERYNVPLDEYLYRCQLQIRAWELAQQKLADPAAVPPSLILEELSRVPVMPRILEGALATLVALESPRPPSPSGEFGPLIIHSVESGQARVVNANVPNHGLIDNLPAGCCVEVPCLVDRNGVQPVQVGPLPVQLAALIQTNVNVQALVVEALVTGRREHIYHAAMLDPHTAAELDLDQIHALVDNLLEAHGPMVPGFAG